MKRTKTNKSKSSQVVGMEPLGFGEASVKKEGGPIKYDVTEQVVSRNTRQLWVVEMRVNQRWEPTTGSSLSRESGRYDLAEWRRANPSTHFQLVKYVVEIEEGK